MRTILGIAIAALFLFAGAGTVAAHEISGIKVDCEAQTLTVDWIKFGGEGDRLMTVTAAGGYVQTLTITTDSGSHAFPLPPNGHGQVDWTNSGDFGPVPFLVECARPTPRPTPNVPHVTPRPHIVPPPTDTTEGFPRLDLNQILTIVVLWFALAISLAALLALLRFLISRPRR